MCDSIVSLRGRSVRPRVNVTRATTPLATAACDVTPVAWPGMQRGNRRTKRAAAPEGSAAARRFVFGQVVFECWETSIVYAPPPPVAPLRTGAHSHARTALLPVLI